MLDFFQKFLCFSNTPKHRSSSSHYSEKKRPVQKSTCDRCGREVIPSLYETHKTMYCKGAPSPVKTSFDSPPKKESKPKIQSHDVSMEISRREEEKEKKKLPEKNQMSRSQVYKHDGDKSIMSQSISSLKVVTSRSRLEQKRSGLEPVVRPRSETREMSKSVKIETPTSKSDQISDLVNELKSKTLAERQPLEFKFIQENIQKKTINEYVVSQTWIAKYKEFLEGKVKTLPGQIVNQKTTTPSNKGLYTVNETVWKFISKLYGGGPEIVRVNRSISISASESDKSSEPRTADTMSANDSVRTTSGSGSGSLKPFLKKTNFSLKPIGMANESFYCYMNSCLQGLLSIGEMAQYASEEKYKSASSKNPKFWKAMNEVVVSHSKKITCTNPKAVRRISSTMFDPDEQHDAHEFLRFLVSGMQDEINLARPKKQVEINDPDMSWAYYRKYNVSIVDDLFAGQLVNRVLCTACKYVSTTYDPFLDLSLPITPGKTVNLDDCLEAFQQEEEIKDSYVCEKCKSKSKAIKRLVVNKFPRYLVIHLKRFQTYPRKRKIIDHINFQMDNWSIKKVFGKEIQTYSLVASIIHRGSFDSGHYTCYSKRNGEWVLCDDETVRSASAKEVANKEAYVLIYERKC